MKIFCDFTRWACGVARIEVLRMFQAKKKFAAGVVKKGTKVNVFYVHYDTHYPGHPGFSNQNKHDLASGKVQFKHKILGVLTTDDQLTQTDQSLGCPDIIYVNDLMKKNSTNRAADDKIILSSDNRSITLDWSLGRKNVVGADAM